jgi:hypothetical protein
VQHQVIGRVRGQGDLGKNKMGRKKASQIGLRRVSAQLSGGTGVETCLRVNSPSAYTCERSPNSNPLAIAPAAHRDGSVASAVAVLPTRLLDYRQQLGLGAQLEHTPPARGSIDWGGWNGGEGWTLV